jgi:CBS domain-containing protein
MTLSLPIVSKFAKELLNEPADSFISKLVESSPDTSLAKIVGLLKERGVYEVFLPEGNRCGIVPARNVLKAANIDLTKTATVMSDVPVVNRESSVGELARVMTDYRIRAVPISDGRRIIGQVNSADILAKLKGKIGSDVRVTSIAAKNPVTIEAEAPIAKARDLMVRKRIDHLPVTKLMRLVGTITSSHIVSRMATPERLGKKSMKPETWGVLDFAVQDAMENDPLTCPPNASADDALGLMLGSARTYILVTQWEELQGIATHRNFMTLIAEVEPDPQVPVFIVGLPEDPFEAEATKAKFRRIVNQLRRVFPDIIEARSIIKSRFSRPGKERGRYEVTVQIRTSRDMYSYSDEGWELPAIYDLITDRLKRLMTRKKGFRRQRVRKEQETL